MVSEVPSRAAHRLLLAAVALVGLNLGPFITASDRSLPNIHGKQPAEAVTAATSLRRCRAGAGRAG